VDDVVAATVAAFERAQSGRVYNVGGGVEATLAEAIATLERLGGETLELRHGPPMAGDVHRTGADVGRLRADTGWEPRASLEDGLAAHLAWARAVAGTVGPR
jgi:nucleoside-diphosphate-sugar epimerase